MALKIYGKDGFYGWVNLAVIFFFNIAIMLMMMSFSLFLRFWVEEFSWSRGWTSGAQTVSIILTGIFAPMVGVFIVKQGAKRAIVTGNLLNVVGLAMLAMLGALWQLYLGYGVIVGMGMCIGGMLAMMTVINNWFVMRRSIALAVSMAGMGFSGLVIMPSLMAMINTLGWRNTFLFMAVFVFIFCVVTPALFIKNKPEDLGQVPDGADFAETEATKQEGSLYKNLYRTPVDFTAKEALRTPALWLLVAYGTILFFVMGGLMTHQIAFLFDLGIVDNLAAMAAGVLSAAMGSSQMAIGFLGLRFKMHSLALVSLIIGMAGFTTVLLAKSLPLVLVYCIFLGIGFGIQSIAMGNLIPDYFGRTEFPKIMGYTMPFTTMLSSTGAPIAGFIRDIRGSYVLFFQIALILLAIAFICMIFAKPPLHPSLKEKQSVVM